MSVTSCPSIELGESLKISVKFLFLRFIYHYQYITHSTNDISMIPFLIDLLKFSFLLWNKPAENRAGSCTHFKLFNHIQSIFGIDSKNSDVRDI